LNADRGALADLAASVADGTPVDWRQLEASSDPANRRLVSHLRLVESISNLHKSIPEKIGSDQQRLTDLAASVADGAAVDWSTAESQIEAHERRFIRHLRLVHSISTLHRTISESEEAAAEAQPGAPAAKPGEPAGPRWGNLVLLEQIGRGMSSEVFRAWDSTLHQEVALKLLYDDGASVDSHARLLDEARRLARVRHGNVVHVYGADQHDKRVGLWMELVRGESLEQIVKARGPFGHREAALIGLDLCAALAAVHGAGLLHRDIKAQNVMREQRGRIVLMDFGTGEELAGTNRLVGTPLYLAPEIFGGQKASVQSDLYSIGVLLFYLVTGQFPVTAASMEQLSAAHARGDRRTIRDLRPDVPRGFVQVIERALNPDPARRHRSAGEFEATLRETIAPEAQPIAQPKAAPAPRPWFRPSFAAAAAVLVALVAALIVWTRFSSPGPSELTSVRKLAVLPMTQSGDSLPNHFAAALTDELMATLGQVRALTIKSVPPERRNGRTHTDLARDLDVDALLATTISASDAGSTPPRVRVTVQLFAAGTGDQLWRNVFERPRGETLALQADVARAIASAVRVALSPTESAQIARARRTTPGAEEAYLAGRMQLSRYGNGSAQLALNAFKRAIELDHDYAAAHAGAAWAHVVLGVNGAVSNDQAHADALASVRRALEIDPNLADAHATLGYINFLYEWDWIAAEASLTHSLELNPGSAYGHGLYLNYLAARGRFPEAIQQATIGTRLEPESGIVARRVALILYYNRDFVGAENALARARTIEPNAAGNAILQARIDEALGRLPRALDATNRALELSAGGSVPLRVNVVRLEALLNHRDKAEAQLAQLQAEADAGKLRLDPRDLGYIQLALGNRDAALEAFSRSVDEHDTNAVWYAVDPRLDSLKSDERFRRLLARIGLPLRP